MKTGRLPIQFAKRLRELIGSGVYEVGTTLPSMDRLRAEYGHSKTTIIAALHLLREEGIIQKGKASRNGYLIVKKPENVGEDLTEGRGNIVKINMPFSVWNWVGSKLLETLESVFTAYGFRLFFSNNNNSLQEETRFLQTTLVRDELIASVLILMTGNSFHNPNVKLLQQLRARLPVIFLDRHIPNMLCHYVGDILAALAASRFV